MKGSMRRLGAVLWLAGAGLATACDSAPALDVTVSLDEGLMVDQLAVGVAVDEVVAFSPRTVPQPRRAVLDGERVRVVLPEDSAGREVVVFVDGWADDALVASGQATVTPVSGQTVVVQVTLGEAAWCGDGNHRVGVEQCDDGNDDNGDGCSAECLLEAGGDGGVSPDAGRDAGADIDAGNDAGEHGDAGADDAGRIDGGIDAGPVDGGMAPTDFVAHWTLDDVSGGTAVDEGGLFAGEVEGIFEQEPGPLGAALRTFPGDVVIRVDGLSSALSNLPALSVAMWFRTAFLEREQKLFQVRVDSDHLLTALQTPEGALRFAVSNGAEHFVEHAEFNADEPTGRWRHAVFLFDSASPQPLSIHLDGEEVTVTVQNPSEAPATTADLTAAEFRLSAYAAEWRGAIDDVYVFDRALAAGERATLFAAGAPPAPPVPPDAVGAWGLDGDLTDATSNHPAGTIQDEASFVPGVSGRALHVDGNYDYADLGTLDELDGADAFTMAFWLRNRLAGPRGRVLHLPASAEIGLRVHEGALGFFVGGGEVTDAAYENVIPRGTWAHVALVYSNQAARIYVNGVARPVFEQGTFPATLSTDIGTANLTLGTVFDRFEGDIDEFVVFDRALGQPELIAQRDAAGPAPAGAPIDGLVAHWSLDGDGTDAVGAYDGSTPLPAEFADGVVGQAFAPTDGPVEIEISAGPIIELSQAPGFTLLTWFLDRAPPTTEIRLIQARENSAEDVGVGVSDVGDMWFDVGSGDDSVGILYTDYRAALPRGIFHHGAFVFDGTAPEDERLRFYFGGTEKVPDVRNNTPPALTADLSQTTFEISSLQNPWQNGLIDEVRIYDRPLREVEVVALHESERMQIPPPLAWWTFDIGFGDEQGGYDGFPGGNVSVGGGDGPVWNVASFDGAADEVTLGPIAEINLAPQLSLAFWARDLSVGTTTTSRVFHCFAFAELDFTVQRGTTDDLVVHLGAGGSNSQGRWTGYGAVASDGAWHHYVVSFDGTATDRVRVFVDGVEVAFVVDTPFPLTTGDLSTVPCSISSTVNSWNGSLDEMRLYTRAINLAEAQALFLEGEPS